jgi:hypothetical protein
MSKAATAPKAVKGKSKKGSPFELAYKANQRGIYHTFLPEHAPVGHHVVVTGRRLAHRILLLV